ncbi:enoyl-ACP reductase FabV [Vibrio cyclitrophicus]|uniref:Enoyl-[acyl-carrier-protein] reductase [NADH] n=1 Tax=Vibrio cyclitrophicus TaxID=47951 RepID=A0A7Z1MIN1_9VIBR|nr:MULTISPECIES: enoyl-ACP reductase FabV [Vibrio]KNH12215.1 trans-2-enoyl-CoA reductase [Vibrio lentus]MBY7660327.1 trans-2-enoyl-CoA reductase family protein [Vibrio atlanticus]KAA8600958.1 putative paraquat-inducible protein B [Vibrio cyclitrophicus]MCC4774410.1 trans-2-enoyl-CoA reductase family protein [Vibrio cyclitrophicus]MCC4841719.1 trans-2-enoyl-CoA reductase family protein [Vibrio cyclitrophicus]|tara:strand:+ start:4106 stop:5305 length:1200 start_codon:yes stop_codon:yes gene_type:complete
MLIEPIIKGVVAKSAHPLGCQEAVKQQIKFVKSAPQIKDGPKRVLILGASSGFGLASRIALTFGGAKADTIGVSFERGPNEKSLGTAGWYNNIYFKKEAEREQRTAINIVGDAFSKETRAQVVEAIETYFEGEVDLIVYSLAAGVRPKPDSDEFWRSAIKPIGESVTGATISLQHDNWVTNTLEAATEEEAESTLKVMGGEDWENWIDELINAESIAPGCKTIAFSYVGPEVTHPIYLDGTLGRAKIDLHQTSHALNLELANFDGNAYATVCKALVTKASVFIPGLSPYLLALYKVMKEKETHEGCIQQMQRLFSSKLYGQSKVPLDGERLIRMDDWELDPETQAHVAELLDVMDGNNFQTLGDYKGFKEEFLQLNGFAQPSVDYNQKLNTEDFIKLKP